MAVLISIWTVLFIGLVTWEHLDHRGEALRDGANEARLVFDRDHLIRQWAAEHGGVYVPVTEKTPPNPNLEFLLERDITTPSGRELTLLNPAYMMRQLNERAAEDYGVVGHITSLKPIRAENAPDPWEAKVLKMFASGDGGEVVEIASIGGMPYLRLMRPMETRAECLTCHIMQGYREGDQWAGVSVSMPLSGILATEGHQITHYLLYFGLVWGIGVAGLMVGGALLRRRELERVSAEEKFRAIYESSNDAIMLLDRSGFIDCNDATLRAFGCSERGDFIGHHPGEWSPAKQPDGRDSLDAASDRIETAFREGRNFFEWTHRRADGENFSAEVLLTPMVLEGRELLQATVRDITERKRNEEEIERNQHVQRVVGSILQYSLKPVSLKEVLEFSLDTILSVPFFAMLNKGTVFLAEEDTETLALVVERGLPESLRSICAKVPYGECLCGRAASRREVVFTDHLDDAHEHTYDGIRPHGHYCVPIIMDGRLLGVVNAYIPAGHKRMPDEERFLTLVADTLAGIIERKRGEEALKKSEGSLLEAQGIAHMGHWELDIVSNRLTWSDEIYRIFGVEPHTFGATYDAFLERVHPEDRELVGRAYDDSVRNRTTYDIVHRLLLSDGTVRYVNERCRTEYDDLGAPLRSLGTVMDITELKRSEDRIIHMAYHDSLTGLPNRMLLNDRIKQVIAREKRKGELAAVLIIDLDRFKDINDTLGHVKGDNLLIAVAERLKKYTRSSDTLARHGGDEFIVVVQDVDNVEDLAGVARRFFSAFNCPFSLDGQEFSITISMGISVCPGDGEDADTLLKNADMALFAAKDEGRNNFRFYTSTLNIDLEARLRLERKLRKAMVGSEFLLHYQPQVDTVTGEVTGMEALVRWQHPEDGLISPGEFIPIAEDTGLIVPIGEWVLRTACARNMAWQDAGFKKIPVSVNVSMRQFRQKDFKVTVEKVLQETGLDPAYLELEVTESILIEDVEDTIKRLKELKRMGIRLSIDDFGTGYSSLAYLKRMPIDMLKVDRSFIRDITVDFDDVTITRATIQMAKNLQMEVIAEGVETREQLDMLSSLDCHRVQGYIFSRPLPAKEAEVFLAMEWRFAMMSMD